MSATPQAAAAPAKPFPFVVFKWKAPVGYRSKFEAFTVNIMRSMLARHYDGPFELVCITDDAEGIDPRVRVLPLWQDMNHIPSPHGHGYPSCYRRLPLFGDRGRELIGDRFSVLDLDTVITGPIRPLIDNAGPFKIWGDTARGTPYNGSFYVMDACSRRQVWDTFDPENAAKRSLARGYIGSDQGWIAACLGPGEAKFGTRDGIYSYRNHIERANSFRLPANARMVMFHGATDPWSPKAKCLGWVKQHYR